MKRKAVKKEAPCPCGHPKWHGYPPPKSITEVRYLPPQVIYEKTNTFTIHMTWLLITILGALSGFLCGYPSWVK